MAPITEEHPHKYSIMLKIIRSYELNNVGLPELAIAMLPIMGVYSYGIFHLYIFLLPIVAVLCSRRKYRMVEFRPLTYIIIFYIIHHLALILLLMLEGGAPSYLYNSFIGTTIILCSIPFVMNALDFRKLKGALNWVCLFSIGGMIYHFILIQSGQIVTPIQLPFLPNPDSTTRIFTEYLRPVSFYTEPAAYCGFIVAPLCLAIYEKKFAYATLITISMFLSTSTTGIAMSIIVWGGAAVFTRTRFIYRVMYVILGIGLLYYLFNSALFESSVNKLNNTKVEETARLSNGPNVIKSMPLEYLVIGAPYPNAYDYSRNANVDRSNFIYERDDSSMLFMSTFWNLIFQFGIVGLILYLNVYFKIYLKDKMLLPYIMVILITMYSDPTLFSSTYAFQLIFMFTFMKRGQSNKIRTTNTNMALS